MKRLEKKLDNMVTEIIRKYGFEHSNTIYFCKVVEGTNKKNLWVAEKIFACMMAGIEY